MIVKPLLLSLLLTQVIGCTSINNFINAEEIEAKRLAESAEAAAFNWKRVEAYRIAQQKREETARIEEEKQQAIRDKARAETLEYQEGIRKKEKDARYKDFRIISKSLGGVRFAPLVYRNNLRSASKNIYDIGDMYENRPVIMELGSITSRNPNYEISQVTEKGYILKADDVQDHSLPIHITTDKVLRVGHNYDIATVKYMVSYGVKKYTSVLGGLIQYLDFVDVDHHLNKGSKTTKSL